MRQSPKSIARWLAAATVATAVVALVAIAMAGAPASKAPAPGSWADRTGVPKGTTLTTVRGDMVVTVPGTVLDSLDLHGKVIVQAPNVTISNSIVRGAEGGTDGALIDATAGERGLTVVDSEIFADVPSASVNGVMGSRFTLFRVNIHHVIDQVHILGPDVTVTDSWLHDNLHYQQDPGQGGGPSHDDNVQVQEGTRIVIQGSRLTGAHNSVLQITQDRGPVADLRFQHNFADGGSCSINVSQGNGGPIRGLTVVDNVFGRSMRISGCAVIAPDSTALHASRNRFEDGEAVKVRRG